MSDIIAVYPYSGNDAYIRFEKNAVDHQRMWVNFMEKRQNSDPVPPVKTSSEIVNSLFAQMLKTLFFALAALAVISFGTIAWFAANSRTQAEGASISAQQNVIRLATKGDRQVPEETYLELADGETEPIAGETYYYTESGTIALRLESELNTFFPGAEGEVTFYIIPSSAEASEITIYTHLAGYQETESGVEQVNSEILDALLNGHILMFYKDEWLGSGVTKEINVSIPENSKDKPVPVTLSWEWPARYKNMAEVSSDSTYRQWLENQNTEGLTPMQEDFSYGYNNVFLAKRDAELADPTVRNDAYNLADEFIGTNAQYLYLTIRTAP